MKKKNVFRRNSGFIVGCVLAAGASYFTADVAMTKGLQSLLMTEDTEASTQGETDTQETLAPESNRDRVIETDAFTVTASGNVIKGVEREVPQQSETQEPESETDLQGEDTENPDGDDGSYDDGSYDDGSYDDGSYTDDGSYSDGSGYTDSYGDGSYYGDGGSYYDDGSSGGYYDDGSYSGESYDGPTIEIQDPGNGGYTYDDGSSGGSSGGDDIIVEGDSPVTPSDVIIQGISSRYIDESELYNYDLGQLRLIRNEIFALHGRIFNSQDLMDYFSQKSWYVPMYSPEEFDANMFDYLNDYEEANLNVILNYEAALAGEV